MTANNIFASDDGQHRWLCDIHINSFLTHLRAQGYAERTLRKKRSVATSFARWTVEKHLAVDDLNESHIVAFEKRLPPIPTARANFEMAALRPFLKHIFSQAGVPISPQQIKASVADDLKQRYIDYLRKERGLTENSILVYAPFISDFLNDLVVKTGGCLPQALDAISIQNFLLDRIGNRSSEYTRLLATALRSFLRFLYLRKETTVDLSCSVPTVRRWHQAKAHGFLSAEEVERVLAAIDLATPRGRRDHAILLLLARLGLRAGEIVLLKLDDVFWRTGEIVVHGKGRVQDRFPLLSDIGEALALYLSQDRGNSVSRQVFLRMKAPCIGLSGPGAVGHIVRYALARAGIRPSSRGAAHLFRHSLATRMIRNGASIAEISEILRHRSQSCTTIYAKVDFEALRKVARSWPGKGGAR